MPEYGKNKNCRVENRMLRGLRFALRFSFRSNSFINLLRVECHAPRLPRTFFPFTYPAFNPDDTLIVRVSRVTEDARTIRLRIKDDKISRVNSPY